MTALFLLGSAAPMTHINGSNVSLYLIHSQMMLTMLRTHSLATYLALGLAPRLVAASTGWHFVQNGTSGIVALESIVVSDNLVIFFDRATNDPLQINGHTAWGALYNLETNTASPLDLKTDSFCASGGFLSNGTMVSLITPAPSHGLIFHRSVLEATSLEFRKHMMVGWESASGNLVTIPVEEVAHCSKTQRLCT